MSSGQERPFLRRGKPAKQKALTNGDDYTIVVTYGTIYWGIVQYYLLAGDVCRLHRPRWVKETSMLKTLAGNHRSSAAKMALSTGPRSRCHTCEICPQAMKP